MNIQRLLPAFALLLVLAACGSGEQKKPKENKAFFPVNAQIMSDLKALDSLPVAVFRYRTEGTRTDTTIVSKQDLRDAARLILDADITGAKTSEGYTESVYMDQSINAVTMSYVPSDKDLPVRKVDVFLEPENDKMKQVYVESVGANVGDSEVVRRMLWSPGHYYQVTSLIGTNKPASRAVVEKYSWESPN
jgi:hypothetical protein